jgi:hypothetical protein
MMKARERRVAPRTRAVSRPAVRVQGMREARLLDLSLTGAQIKHLDLIPLDAACVLDLPPPETLSLPAQVAWCTVIGRKRKQGGESDLVARSGLRFSPLTVGQQVALTDTLQRLGTARQPNA